MLLLRDEPASGILQEEEVGGQRYALFAGNYQSRTRDQHCGGDSRHVLLFGQYSDGDFLWSENTPEFDGEGGGGGGAEEVQLGMGYSYFRGELKFNPVRSDNMIVHAIALINQMDRDLNIFAVRVKIWYSYYFPELRIIIEDNYMFTSYTVFIHVKQSFFLLTVSYYENQGMENVEEDFTDKLLGLIKILGDYEMANTICADAKTSMGMECSPINIINIINFMKRMVRLAGFKKQLTLYLT